MNKQEIFDKSYKAIIKQGNSAVKITDSGNAQCTYRAKDGCKCAIGHLITDEEAKAFECFGSVNQFIRKAVIQGNEDYYLQYPEDKESKTYNEVKIPSWIVNNDKFCQDIQQAHDDVAISMNSNTMKQIIVDDKKFLEGFIENMAVLAKENNLTIPS